MRPSLVTTNNAWPRGGLGPGRAGSPGRAPPSCRWPRRPAPALANPPAGCGAPNLLLLPAPPR
eukprot:5563988-Lingulodinium_polyedra.AAC.1